MPKTSKWTNLKRTNSPSFTASWLLTSSPLVNLSMKKPQLQWVYFILIQNTPPQALSPRFSLISEVVSINSDRFKFWVHCIACIALLRGFSQSSDLNPPQERWFHTKVFPRTDPVLLSLLAVSNSWIKSIHGTLVRVCVCVCARCSTSVTNKLGCCSLADWETPTAS